MIPTLTWTPEGVRFIDQTKLPLEESYVLATTYEQVADVIVTMVVRGAPAIGVSAAYGVALGAKQTQGQDTAEFAPEFERICARLAATRPTAVNLFWAIDRMKALFANLAGVRRVARTRSRNGCWPRRTRCTRKTLPPARRWARLARRCCRDEGGVLTHCNAGALATCGYGTALGVIRAAVERGKKIHVYADETRPFLQGARLTAWELMADGIPTTVICDNMAASLMRAGQDQGCGGGRGPHCGQRRRGQQDRHLQRGDSGDANTGFRFMWRRRGRRSTWRRRRATRFRSRSGRRRK